MHTLIDLDAAARAGIIGEDQATALRNFQAKQDGLSSATSEKFVLFGGYTDLIAALGSGMVAYGILFLAFINNNGPPSSTGYFLFFFIFSMLSALIVGISKKTNLRALPALTTVLLLGVFGYIAFSLQNLFVGVRLLFEAFDKMSNSEHTLLSCVAFSIGAVLTYKIFWKIVRFPLIPALFTAFLAFTISAIGDAYGPAGGSSTWERSFDVWARILLGICTLAHAIWWDLSDVRRETERSQIAFWLHCVAGFLIIGSIGLLLGTESIDPNGPRRMVYSASDFAIVFAMITAAATISLLLDRRSFLTGAIFPLCWMLSPGGVPLGVPIAGGLLLFFTIYWAQMRTKLLEKLPRKIAAQLPRTELTSIGRRPTRQHLPYLRGKW